MELSILREFMFLSRDLNFTKTAERCYVSQSVLSRHIQALEHEINSKLLVRDKKGVHLTPAGDVFATACKRMAVMISFTSACPDGCAALTLGVDGYDIVVPAGHPLANAGHGVSLVRHLALEGVYLSTAAVVPVDDASLRYVIRVEWKKSDEDPVLRDFVAILEELCA